jgi:hypothetical protein
MTPCMLDPFNSVLVSLGAAGPRCAGLCSMCLNAIVRARRVRALAASRLSPVKCSGAAESAARSADSRLSGYVTVRSYPGRCPRWCSRWR